MSYFSLLRVHCDESKCVHCGKCLQTCPMNVEINRESHKGAALAVLTSLSSSSAARRCFISLVYTNTIDFKLIFRRLANNSQTVKCNRMYSYNPLMSDCFSAVYFYTIFCTFVWLYINIKLRHKIVRSQVFPEH